MSIGSPARKRCEAGRIAVCDCPCVSVYRTEIVKVANGLPSELRTGVQVSTVAVPATLRAIQTARDFETVTSPRTSMPRPTTKSMANWMVMARAVAIAARIDVHVACGACRSSRSDRRASIAALAAASIHDDRNDGDTDCRWDCGRTDRNRRSGLLLDPIPAQFGLRGVPQLFAVNQIIVDDGPDETGLSRILTERGGLTIAVADGFGDGFLVGFWCGVLRYGVLVLARARDLRRGHLRGAAAGRDRNRRGYRIRADDLDRGSDRQIRVGVGDHGLVFLLGPRAVHVGFAHPKIGVAQHLDRVVAVADRGRRLRRPRCERTGGVHATSVRNGCTA